MPSAPFPPDEAQRLVALQRTQVLDSEAEASFDDAAKLAAQICGTPIALVSLVDENRQWFKARVGLEAKETPRDLAFCAHAILTPELFVVRDAREDPRFADNPLVQGEPHIVFYAGAPLTTDDGYSLGTLCVVDHVPRELSESQSDSLRILARQVSALLELRQRSAALTVVNADLEHVVENTTVMVQGLNADGRIESVNGLWLDTLGYDQDEVVGHRIFEFVPEDESERIRAHLAKGRVGEESGEIVTAFMARAGDRIPVAGNVRFFDNGTGESRALAIFRNVSKRILAESEVDGFFTLALDLLCVVSPDGYFKRLNPAWETTLGYSRDELLARPHLDFIHPDDREATAAEAKHLAAGGITLSFRNRYAHKDGGYRWLHWSAVASHDRQRLFAIARDITELRQTEADLLQSRARLAAVLDAAVDGILTIDERGSVISANPAVEQLFGYKADELIGGNVTRLMPEPYRSEHDDYLQHYLRTGEARIIGIGRDVKGRRKDGSVFPAYLAVGEMPGSGERQFVGILRDVTELHRHREQLEAQAQDLAHLSSQANAANRLKSEFLANMSHELRTPLNGILGFARLLHDGETGPVTDEQREFLGYVLTSGEHLLQLINDVLDLAKVEAGKLAFHPELVELERLVVEVCSIVRELAAKKRLRIITEIDPQVNSLVLDPARLKQVFYNYLSNAIKFSAEEGRIVIRAVPVDADRVRLEVQDWGIGIAADDLEQLWKEFRQVDAGANTRHQGTGLGLVLTKRLIEAQGGTVGATSEVGVGSTFWAILPRFASKTVENEVSAETELGAAQLVEATHVAPGDEEAARPPVDPSTATRILIIEDDAKERAWLRRTLGGAGYIIDAAATGSEAIQRARSRRYQAITLDLFLPDMTGWDVLSALRAEGLNQDTPAIVVTVVADKNIATGYQIQDFLVKPAQGNEILGALERIGVEAPAHPILIVDDDPAARRLATDALERRGFSVVTADDGEEGLEIARRERPAAIILDLMMPRLDGFGFLDRFRRLPGAADTPVIVWSSKQITAQEQIRLQADAQSIVLKGAGATHALLEELRVQLSRKP